MEIRIGSRGSALALWQAHHVSALLEAEGHSVSVEVIRTTGDRLQGISFNQVGTKGMFTKEIEEALMAGRIDLAVHSLKDLPTELDPAFTLLAIPRRADARDAFISGRFPGFAALPSGARVGTSSLRRQSQLRAYRADLEYIEFRGNVDTRLRKMLAGEAEACVLAAAGLDRLGRLEFLRERLPPAIVCPAAGQGALAIEGRSGDARMLEALSFLDDAETRFAVTAERAALGALGGGCQVPIGIYCEQHTDARGAHWQITGAVGTTDGRGAVKVTLEHRSEGSAVDLGLRMAQELLRQGAGVLLGQ